MVKIPETIVSRVFLDVSIWMYQSLIEYISDGPCPCLQGRLPHVSISYRVYFWPITYTCAVSSNFRYQSLIEYISDNTNFDGTLSVFKYQSLIEYISDRFYFDWFSKYILVSISYRVYFWLYVWEAMATGINKYQSLIEYISDSWLVTELSPLPKYQSLIEYISDIVKRISWTAYFQSINLL